MNAITEKHIVAGLDKAIAKDKRRAKAWQEAQEDGLRLVPLENTNMLGPEWWHKFNEVGCEFSNGIMADCGHGDDIILLVYTPGDCFVFVAASTHGCGVVYRGPSGVEATKVFLEQIGTRS